MGIYAGTSGFSYKEWKGVFYPEKLPNAQMLSYYARRLPSVEINNTFYRLPKKEAMASWAQEVPDGFLFALKASRRITHFKRLKEADDVTEYMFSTASSLAEKLGPVLFQLPPNFPKDIDRLREFIPLIPPGIRVAFEFRHVSWADSEVYDTLSKSNIACCLADSEEGPAEMIGTADWGYLRLRRPGYTDSKLEEWAARIAAQAWSDTFVFFKHEDEGAGPEMASRFLKLFLP